MLSREACGGLRDPIDDIVSVARKAFKGVEGTKSSAVRADCLSLWGACQSWVFKWMEALLLTVHARYTQAVGNRHLCDDGRKPSHIRHFLYALCLIMEVSRF